MATVRSPTRTRSGGLARSWRGSVRRVVARAAILLLFLTLVYAQSARYRELRAVIDRNTGFAHMTRGVNMYTLYALRSCVNQSDIPVLRDLLRDKDRITRMASASVLADMGDEGKAELQSRLSGVTDAGEKLMLRESLDIAGKQDYRPILQYPLTAAERARIRGCK